VCGGRKKEGESERVKSKGGEGGKQGSGGRGATSFWLGLSWVAAGRYVGLFPGD